jgi:23S rRNA U2552 (ribose-2'-O)-methylase RlmE/FtsJ
MSKKYETEITSIKITYNPDFKYDELTSDKLLKDLNTYKKFLDDFKGNYQMFTKSMDAYFGLKSVIKKKYNGQAVSNAWLKMYEMLTHYTKSGDLKIKSKLTMFGNAELPGAFLSATNHFLADHFPKTKFKWLACSYLGEDPTKLGDTYGIYKHNRDNWLMGPDLVGDLTKIDDIKAIAKKVNIAGGVDLYTSDAGIDVEGDYAGQEKKTLSLNYGQILSGLSVLNIGGCMITKQYTYMSKFNQTLINYLSTIFKSFYICKPLTSRPANSEIYLVGCGFKGINILDKLYSVNCDMDFDFKVMINDNAIDIKDGENNCIKNSLIEITNKQIEYLKEYKEYADKTEDYMALYNELSSKFYRELSKKWLNMHKIKFLKSPINCD